MRQSGFTLLELLASIAIIGVLSAVSIAGYGKLTLKYGREQAKQLLAVIDDDQTDYLQEHGRYAKNMKELGYTDTLKSLDGRYYVALRGNGKRYEAYAIPVKGKRQAKDPCGWFVFNSEGRHGIKPTRKDVEIKQCWGL